MKERGGVAKGMSMTKEEEGVTESKGDEEKEDEVACKIDPGDQVRRRNNLKAEEDFKDSTFEDEIVKNQQSLEDQMEEASECNVTESQTKMISDDKASVSYSCSDVPSIWQ